MLSTYHIFQWHRYKHWYALGETQRCKYMYNEKRKKRENANTHGLVTTIIDFITYKGGNRVVLRGTQVNILLYVDDMVLL